MASSANYATNLQELPSIFEINAAELLDKLLYPALSKVFQFISDKYTIKFGDLSPVLVVAIQYLYLKKRGGSFGESFYGLQRTINSGYGHSKEFISALSLTFLPFLEKLLKDRTAQHEAKQYEKHLLKFFNIFNIVKSIYTLTYLAKITKTHSPIFQFLKLRINYSTPGNDKLTYWILKSIEIFAFFLQFTQWWYGNNQNMKIGKLNNPKPIDKNETDINMCCPICLQKFKNPTASAISGYVYCWQCICLHLKNQKRCPVTDYPMNIDDLIRIYEN